MGYRWLMPFCVAVSGGIASGKSSVCSLLQSFGIDLVDADLIARDLVQPGQPALQEIAQQIGAQFIQADGHLNRALLREHVFSDQSAKDRLEKILHPLIQAELLLLCSQSKSAYVVVAIPLLSPAMRKSAYAWINRVLIVEAPKAMQLSRIVTRDEVSPTLANAMIDAQLNFSERLPMADDVIINDADLMQLRDWTTRMHKKYLALTTTPP
jgi:dephospho-CoA kinase